MRIRASFGGGIPKILKTPQCRISPLSECLTSCRGTNGTKRPIAVAVAVFINAAGRLNNSIANTVLILVHTWTWTRTRTRKKGPIAKAVAVFIDTAGGLNDSIANTVPISVYARCCIVGKAAGRTKFYGSVPRCCNHQLESGEGDGNESGG